MKGFVTLENGTSFQGRIRNRNQKEVTGNIVFYTGMTGYEEVITHPSFHGQIVVFTYPFIGACGWRGPDIEEGKGKPAGIVLDEVATEAFHYESRKTFLKAVEKGNIPLITDVDTRALVHEIRKQGESLARIGFDSSELSLKEKEKDHFVHEMSVSSPVTFGDSGSHVVMIDFGYTPSLITKLVKSHRVTVVPYDYSLEEISSLQPDIIFFSNGPGSPLQLKPYVKTYQQLATMFPTFGLGLGHQVIALSFGAKIEKMHVGHHGMNQPVQCMTTNRVIMTKQHHSYLVSEDGMPESFQIQYRNINDDSIEGLSHETYPISTVQFDWNADSEHIFQACLEDLKKRGREKTYA